MGATLFLLLQKSYASLRQWTFSALLTTISDSF